MNWGSNSANGIARHLRCDMRIERGKLWRFNAPADGVRAELNHLFGWRGHDLRLSIRIAHAAALVTLALALIGCQKPVEPVTITFLDPEGLQDMGDRRLVSDSAIREFTAETGIRIIHLPTPQDNRAQVQLIRDLLQSGASTPDVYGIDSIWPGMFAEYLIDLRPYFPAKTANIDTDVLAAYTIDGKLTGIPYHPNSGVLYYRADLLRKYGYSVPPRTWDELEQMAAKIQQGERAGGQKDFWGFVWPGTTKESVAHIATEWQVTQSGGHTIEANKIISVNNPNAIRAWERGAHWVNWISPPSIPSYTEWDASNAFWIAGNAAFTRGWADYFQRHPLGRAIPSGRRRHEHSARKRSARVGFGRMGSERFAVFGAPGGSHQVCRVSSGKQRQIELDQAKSGPRLETTSVSRAAEAVGRSISMGSQARRSIRAES